MLLTLSSINLIYQAVDLSSTYNISYLTDIKEEYVNTETYTTYDQRVKIRAINKCHLGIV